MQSLPCVGQLGTVGQQPNQEDYLELVETVLDHCEGLSLLCKQDSQLDELLLVVMRLF